LTQHASTRAPHREADASKGLSRIDQLWPRAQPLVMGILNCTPNSFADGGRSFEFDDSLRHAEELLTGGTDIIDVGGESTRPGADPVNVTEELRRVVPVITEIRRRWPDITLSVDTSKVAVAEASLAAGADLVNDVTSASADGMLELVARSRRPPSLLGSRPTGYGSTRALDLARMMMATWRCSPRCPILQQLVTRYLSVRPARASSDVLPAPGLEIESPEPWRPSCLRSASIARWSVSTMHLLRSSSSRSHLASTRLQHELATRHLA